ncbi:MAG: DUF4350 domain-containing protein [Candidatus Heimdallarchaeota archaeon]|nr:MAG: DUF4350 domain-containing protein [Candidatus Heimdallarchaeota archaeon]
MRKPKREYLIGILCAVVLILLIPPLQPASFTIENRNWDGLSKFKALIEKNNDVTVGETTIPLRLLGEIEADIIVIVGGNLPYFTEESNYLREFVENGGDVILFEDHGYARILTSAFGISLGGTIIDQNKESHDRNPYLPVVNEYGIGFPEQNSSVHTLVFNKAVRVSHSRSVQDSTFYPLFVVEGRVWEDKNNDGKFYRTNESVVEDCYLGGKLTFNNHGGNFIVIGDSAFPTNDMINQKGNQDWLSDLFSYLLSNGGKKVLFDESRKLWIPPTGKAAVGTITVLIMSIFHSPLIAIVSVIIIGGIIGMRRTEQINKVATNFQKSLRPQKDVKPIPAFLQSEEENELARLSKRSVISDLYRAMLTDEIRQIAPDISPLSKARYENYLRYRYIDVNLSSNLIEELKNIRKEEK